VFVASIVVDQPVKDSVGEIELRHLRKQGWMTYGVERFAKVERDDDDEVVIAGQWTGNWGKNGDESGGGWSCGKERLLVGESE